MKQVITIVFCMLLSFSYGQVFYGINGGINIGNLNSYSRQDGNALNASLGYSISSDVNIPVSSHTYLQTGLQYENYHGRANSKISFESNGILYKESLSANLNAAYLNIPVKLCFKLPSKQHLFIAGAGPFLGIGLNGRIKANSFDEVSQNGSIISSNTTNINQAISFGNGQDQVKKLNAGIGLQLSYLLKTNINLSIYSNLGLTNLSNDAASSAKTSSAGFTIGYLFGKK